MIIHQQILLIQTPDEISQKNPPPHPHTRFMVYILLRFSYTT
jgi:hypothetical protein